MTFRQMELFLAVCEHKSINKVSKLYFISQQGISKAIKSLEDELKCQLLYRNAHGVTPTKYGFHLLNEFRMILDKKDFICSHLTELEDFSQEIIFLGMSFGMISAISYKCIKEFEKKYPFTKIHYTDHADFYLEKLLRKGDYDFCITTGILDTNTFSYEKLGQKTIYLCIPKSHELYNYENITMDNLKQYKFAMFNCEFHIHHNFLKVCEQYNFDPIIEVTSGDFNSLKEISYFNNLLFTVPEHTIIHLDDNNFRYCPFPDNSFHWSIYFIKRKNKVLTESMLNFYYHIKSYFL